MHGKLGNVLMCSLRDTRAERDTEKIETYSYKQNVLLPQTVMLHVSQDHFNCYTTVRTTCAEYPQQINVMEFERDGVRALRLDGRGTNYACPTASTSRLL